MKTIKILLVDDEEDFLKIMGARIRTWGYDLIRASSGKEAAIAFLKQHPHIVIVDYMMPEMNGFRTLEELRKIDRRILVILLTAYPSESALNEARKLGVSAFIPKASAHSNLQESLKEALRLVVKTFPEGRRKRLDKKKILIIDDEPDIRDMMGFRLKMEGYRVLTARDGAEGMELAEKKRPDLIILDVVMTDISGYGVSASLKENEKTKAIPIIMMSGRRKDPKGIQLTEKAGAVDFLEKPFDSKHLLERIREVLKTAA